MRLRIYIDGKPDWRDIGEGYARIPSHHGELVRGEPGNVAKNRRHQEKYKAKAVEK